MDLSVECRLRIGKLGALNFKPGWYAYAGSAMGPGGLGARLKRHAGMDKNKHWHMDYLTAVARVREMWFTTDLRFNEHSWTAVLVRPPYSGKPVAGFGASDCTCPSHLFHFAQCPALPLQGFSMRGKSGRTVHAGDAIGRVELGTS